MARSCFGMKHKGKISCWDFSHFKPKSKKLKEGIIDLKEQAKDRFLPFQGARLAKKGVKGTVKETRNIVKSKDKVKATTNTIIKVGKGAFIGATAVPTLMTGIDVEKASVQGIKKISSAAQQKPIKLVGEHQMMLQDDPPHIKVIGKLQRGVNNFKGVIRDNTKRNKPTKKSKHRGRWVQLRVRSKRVRHPSGIEKLLDRYKKSKSTI